MSEKQFNCVLGKDYHIINNNVDNMTYFLQDGNDVVLVINLLNKLYEENEKLQKENNDYEKQFRIINEKLDEYIKTADTYRIPISSLKYGDELGYFNGVYQYMKKLKKDIGVIEDEEKRFTFGPVSPNFAMIKDNGEPMDTEEVVDCLNEQQSTIQSLKEEKDSLVAVIDENLLKVEHDLSIKHKEAKDKMKKGESSEVSAILDVIFYWRGYIKALEELKERVSDE